MAQYHNTTGTTAKMGTKFYYVIKYTSSSSEPKHLVFWDVSGNYEAIFKHQGKNYGTGNLADYVL